MALSTEAGRVVLEDVSFAYPIYDIGSRSMKVSLFSRLTGGSEANRAGVVKVEALRKVSFSLKDGDRLGLIGRNGSGKSTLLRVLAGLAHPQSGKVQIAGRVVPLIERGLGIDPDLSGLANIELPLRLLGATTAEVKRAVEEIPEFTGLGDFIKLPVRTYSDGMKARLSFAICTAIHADVLVLDEWLGAGDAEFQQKAQERLQGMVDRTRVVVLASHSNDLIRQVCNRALWLDRGVPMMLGAPGETIDAYLAATTRPPVLAHSA
jgi:ABC-type polysaccharide/polyol phosphate transport system ATPase subunit